MRFPLPRLAALAAAIVLVPASAAVAAPTFSNYVGPTDLVSDAGEPSIGFNPKTGTTFFQSYVTTAKVGGFDGAGHATWTDVTEPTGTISLDPILWTDRDTGRTFSSQLLLACSKAMFTDDDGGHLAAVAGLRRGHRHRSPDGGRRPVRCAAGGRHAPLSQRRVLLHAGRVLVRACARPASTAA